MRQTPGPIKRATRGWPDPGLLIFNLEMDNWNWLTRHIQLGDRAYVHVVSKNGKVVIHPGQRLMAERADYSDRAPVAQAVEGPAGWAE